MDEKKNSEIALPDLIFYVLASEFRRKQKKTIKSKKRKSLADRHASREKCEETYGGKYQELYEKRGDIYGVTCDDMKVKATKELEKKFCDLVKKDFGPNYDVFPAQLEISKSIDCVIAKK
eukprot:Nk52_evm1s1987 gene=Nk52_evmTU1s1987